MRDDDDDLESDADFDDPEAPDASDQDSFDDPSLDSCPHCNKLIHEDTERCPHCGEYISLSDAPSKLPGWMLAALILLAISFGYWMFVSGHWL